MTLVETLQGFFWKKDTGTASESPSQNSETASSAMQDSLSDVAESSLAAQASPSDIVPARPLINPLFLLKEEFSLLQAQAMETPLFSQSVPHFIELNIEYYTALKELEDMLQADELVLNLDKAHQIQQFFTKRWRRIQATFFDYTASSSLPFTLFCEKLALLIFPLLKEELPGEEEQKCHYQIMMPTLERLEDVATGALLKDYFLNAFILSEDGKSFIPVHDTFSLWLGSSGEQASLLRMNQNNQVVPMTEAEQKKLKFHSAPAEDCFQQTTQYHARREKLSAATAMRMLVSGLHEGSVRRDGVEYQADISIFRYINAFREFLSHCSEQDKAKILTATNGSGGRPFAHFWNTLTVANSTSNSSNTWVINVGALAAQLSGELCVDQISRYIDYIVSANPFLEAIFPISGLSTEIFGHIPAQRFGTARGVTLEQLKAAATTALNNLAICIEQPHFDQPFALPSVAKMEAHAQGIPAIKQQLFLHYNQATVPESQYLEPGNGTPFYNGLLQRLPEGFLSSLITSDAGMQFAALFGEVALFELAFNEMTFDGYLHRILGGVAPSVSNAAYERAAVFFPKKTIGYLIQNSLLMELKEFLSQQPIFNRKRLFLYSVLSYPEFYQTHLVHFLFIVNTYILPFQDQLFTSPEQQNEFKNTIYSAIIKNNVPLATIFEAFQSYPVIFSSENALKQAIFLHLLRQRNSDALIDEMLAHNSHSYPILKSFTLALLDYSAEKPIFPNREHYFLQLLPLMRDADISLQTRTFQTRIFSHLLGQHNFDVLINEIAAHNGRLSDNILMRFTRAFIDYFRENPDLPNQGHYFLKLLNTRQFNSDLTYFIFSENITAITAEIISRGSKQYFYLDDFSAKQKKQISYLYVAPDPLAQFLNCRERDSESKNPNEFPIQFLTMTVYALMTRSYALTFSMGGSRKDTMMISEPASNSKMLIDEKLFKGIFSSLPSVINKIYSLQEKKNFLKQMIRFYIEHRQLVLHKKGNNFFTVLHFSGYSGELKIAAAQALLNRLNGESNPVSPEVVPVLEQGILGTLFSGYKDLMQTRDPEAASRPQADLH